MELALMESEQQQLKLVVYVSVGIVTLLLLFTAHAYSRLSFVTEVLYRRC